MNNEQNGDSDSKLPNLSGLPLRDVLVREDEELKNSEEDALTDVQQPSRAIAGSGGS